MPQSLSSRPRRAKRRIVEEEEEEAEEGVAVAQSLQQSLESFAAVILVDEEVL